MDTAEKYLATGVIKAISSFLAEFEGAKTQPNIVFLNLQHFNALSKYFPYMVEGLTLKYEGNDFRIVITKDVAVGMAFAFHTDYVLEYN